MSKRTSILLQVVFFAAFLALLLAIVFGVVYRDFTGEGNLMLSVYWGQFTMVDIYVAFIVVYLWIIYRERSLWRSILWFILVMTGGSMTICLYVFLAVRGCGQSWDRLWKGRRWVGE